MCSRIFEPKNVRTEFWYEIWFKFKNVYYHSARAFFRCLRVTRAGHVMYTLRVDKGGFICNMHTRIAVAFANWNFLLFLGLNIKSSSGQMRMHVAKESTKITCLSFYLSSQEDVINLSILNT